MRVIPAVDLREGACVQLVGGAYERERVRLEDPCAVVRDWAALGFMSVHVVDLDAATGRGSNAGVVRDVVATSPMQVHLGGGLRSCSDVAAAFALGAHRAVIGTRAVEDAVWRATIASMYPGRVIVAADVNGRDVTTRGWSRNSGRDIADFVAELNALPLGGILVTAVHREGQLQGTDLALMEEIARASRVPVYASGGITTVEELRELARVGIRGAIIGMALYTGALDGRALAEEFASE